MGWLSMQIEKVKTLGVESVTLYHDKPYFMLFCDIDKKDPENLLSILKYFEKWHYSVYWYETTKGYHIISPILLTFRTWLFRTESLRKKIPNYRFGALRISRRINETKLCHFERWNYDKFKESATIHDTLKQLFVIENHVFTKPKETKLFYVYYDQLNYSIDGSKKSSTISLDHLYTGSQDVNQEVKSNETLIQNIYEPTLFHEDYSLQYEKEEMFFQ